MAHQPLELLQRELVQLDDPRPRAPDASIEEISWKAGYEDPASFRRLFKRITRITPGAYRRKFRLPDFARARPAEK